MLEKSEMKDVNYKMSEQDNMILMVDIKSIAKTNLADVERRQICRPFRPIQRHLFELLESHVPFNISIGNLTEYLWVFFENLHFFRMWHLNLEPALDPLIEQPINFGKGKPLVVNFHIFDHLPHSFYVQSIEYLFVCTVYQIFII